MYPHPNLQHHKPAANEKKKEGKEMMMSEKLSQALAIYAVLEQKLSEEDFTTLATIAQSQGGLGELYQEIKVRADTYRSAREAFMTSGDADEAKTQQDSLLHVERQMAIIEYLRFA